MHTVRATVLLSSLLVFAACGGGEDDPIGNANTNTNTNATPTDTTAPTTTATPTGSKLRRVPDQVALVANESATVYFTTDGSPPTTSSSSAFGAAIITEVADGVPIRFFAVDDAGNQETEKSETFTVDVTGPAPVSALAAVVENTDVTLSWTNPNDTDFVGLIVVASAGTAFSSTPEDGRVYSVGDTLSGGEEVVFVGSATSFQDTMVLGAIDYGVFSHDDLANYSELRSAFAKVAIPPQPGTLSVDLTTGVVTVTSPTDTPLTAEATYNETTDILTVNLTITNQANQILHGLRGEITSISQGTVSGVGTFNGNPAVRLGGLGLAPERRRTRSFTVDGVDGAIDPIVIEMVVSDSEVALVDDDIVDLSGVNSREDMTPGSDRSIAAGPLGQFGYYGGDKNEAEIEVVDLTTERVVQSALVSNAELTHIAGIKLDRGMLYVGLVTGGHWLGGNGQGGGDWDDGGQVSLVKLDSTSLEECARVNLGAPGRVLVRAVEFSPDGAMIAVSVNRLVADAPTAELWLLEAATLTIIDTDAGTEGDQPVSLTPARGIPEHVSWTEDGTQLLVGFNRFSNNGRLATMDTTTAPYDTVTVADFSVVSAETPIANALFVKVIDRDGRRFYVTDQGVAVETLSDNTVTTLTLPLEQYANALFSRDASRYFIGTSNNASGDLIAVDSTTNTVIDVDGDMSNGDTTIDARITWHNNATLVP